MYYRSDWPEIGWLTALTEQRPAHLEANQNRVIEIKLSKAILRWVATQSRFESSLYKLPIWNLHLEIDDADSNVLTPQLDSLTLREFIGEGVSQLLNASPWGIPAYVTSKLVKNEPLYKVLHQVGFHEVEHRRLYSCKVGDIVSKTLACAENDIRFTSLAAIAPEQLPAYREQILDICREAFEAKGYSRHFTDPILLERQPGIAYILAVMSLNFEHVTLNRFLAAVDLNSGQVCGFSVVGNKFEFAEDRYTQLLSAVRQAYRGRGIYLGLTNLLAQTLPPHVTLLNVTHADNRLIQRAYQNSGRVHLANTVVLRRVCDTNKKL